jgi:hypothetical protein
MPARQWSYCSQTSLDHACGGALQSIETQFINRRWQHVLHIVAIAADYYNRALSSAVASSTASSSMLLRGSGS